MRVTFVHGLESGPHGRKTRLLAACGYNVTSVQMPSGKRMLWDPLFLLLGAVIMGVLVAAPLLLVLVPVLYLARRRVASWLKPFAVRRMLHRSVQCQIQQLARAASPPQLVVGSSFGGAVVVEMIRRGAISCPVILLAPAAQLVADMCNSGDAFCAPAYAGRQVLIIHGAQDTVVPVEQSRALAKGLQCTLVEVEDGHELYKTWKVEAIKQWVKQVCGGE